MFRKEKTVITAVEFLNMYLEFNTMTPKKKDWNRRKLADSPPWLTRLLRLEALIKAFELRTKLVDFHEGSWIDWKNPAYDPFLAEAGAEIPANPVEAWDTEEYRWGLRHLFEELLEYRIRLEGSLDSGTIGLESFGPVFYASRRISSVNKAIRQNLAVIEEPLTTIISPDHRSFQVKDLARDFGYPDLDLNAIDLDWIT